MKRNLIIITLIALIASACSTSVQMTGRYVDDLYYWPGDTPLEEAGQDLPQLGSSDKKSNDEMIIVSKVGEDTNGNKTLDNYIYSEDEPDWYSNVQAQNIENMNKTEEDTLVLPSSDNETYIVNNYYQDEDDYYSYSDRIRRFHDPYYYDPYWNYSLSWGWDYPYYSWNYPYSSFYGWNSWYWDPWYYSWGYSPYYYNSWYWGYNDWCSPYYSNYYGHHHSNWNDNKNNRDDNVASNRRSRNPNAVYEGGGVSTASGGRSYNESGIAATTNKSVNSQGRRTVTNQSDDTRKSVSTSQDVQKRNGAILTEKRRSSANLNNSPSSSGRNITKTTENSNGSSSVTPAYRAPAQNYERRGNSSGNSNLQNSSNTRSNNYIPSYNKPRTNTRATYNTNRTSESTRYSSPTENRSTISHSRPVESH